MAMRENTGLQIALILFVMITVVLAVTTYLYFDSASKAEQRELALMKERDNLKKSVDNLNLEIEKLRNILGYKTTAEGGVKMEQIETNFKSDMAKFGEGYEGKRDYRALPQYLWAQLVDKNKDLVAANERIATLADQLDAARAQEQKNVKAHEATFAQAVEDYNTQKAEFVDRRTELVTRVDGIQQAYDKTSREVASIKATKDKEIDALTDRVAKLDLLRKTLNDKIEATQNPTSVGGAAKPDGKVTWVSQRGGTIYINLGSADGLRRSTTFTVYDAGAVNLAQTDPKGSIEVTTIRGPHLAEARIVEDNLSNPILSQDNIYSPVWDPGQKTHFALVGFMDIDDDRKSDRRLIRSLIAQNGGVIDAEVLDDGTREGKLTINTRYLVQGERPTDKSNAESLRSYSRMIDEASDLGIETVSVERLLSDMGWRGSERTVEAGSAPTGGQFRPKSKEDDSETRGFQQRTRPGGEKRRGSAY